MILGSYPDPANSTSKYSDLLPGRKCLHLPGHSLQSTTEHHVFAFAIAGSGAYNAMAVLESGFKENMGVRVCI